ncbi:MAG: GSU3529 family protein [Deferribacterales bacterium]
MDIYEKLLKSALKASDEQELPDNILVKIKKIYEAGTADEKALSALVEMLEDYEPFADVGCGNESYSTKDIETAVNKLIG